MRWNDVVREGELKYKMKSPAYDYAVESIYKTHITRKYKFTNMYMFEEQPQKPQYILM